MIVRKPIKKLVLVAIPPELVVHPTKSLFERARCFDDSGATSLINRTSAENLDRYRVPQWRAELTGWRHLIALDMIMMSMRVGEWPRLIGSTTSRPKSLISELAPCVPVVTIRDSLIDNFDNLAPTFNQQLMQYEGTQLGRQEIYGEILDAEEGGVIKRGWFNLWPNTMELPAFDNIIMSLDTAFTEQSRDQKTGDADPTACSVWGVFTRNPIGNKGKATVNIMLLECWEAHLSYPDLLDKVREELKCKYGGTEQKPMLEPMWGPPNVEWAGKTPDTVIIEDKGSGISLRQSLERENIFTYRYNPGKADKLARLHAVSHIARAGLIYLIESKENPTRSVKWADDFLARVCAYSGKGSTQHDDFVNAYLAAETKIVTHKGLVAISEICVGDLVLTHKGRFRSVTDVRARQSDHLYRFKAKSLDEIAITGAHPVWVSGIRYKAASFRFAEEPQFKAVQTVIPRSTYTIERNGKKVSSVMASKHDAVLLPAIRPEATAEIDVSTFLPEGAWEISADHITMRHGQAKGCARRVPLNQDTGFLFGLFIAEGCVSGNRDVEHAYVHIACNLDAVSKCAQILRQYCGVSASLRYAGTHWALTFSRRTLAPLFASFGDRSQSRFVPEWVFTAPDDFVRGFIAGYSEGDGHFDRRRGKYTITSTSLSALWGLRLLMLRVGIHATICESKAAGIRVIFGRDCNCMVAYALSYRLEQKYTGVACWRDEGAAFYVEHCKREDGDFKVYSIVVSEDDSYVTTGGTVQNLTRADLTAMRLKDDDDDDGS